MFDLSVSLRKHTSRLSTHIFNREHYLLLNYMIFIFLNFLSNLHITALFKRAKFPHEKAMKFHYIDLTERNFYNRFEHISSFIIYINNSKK